MANLFDVYTKLHKQQKPKTLLAIHASDEYLFFEEDAKRISDVLGEEMTSYKITYGHNANVFKLPVNRTEEVFGQLIDEGYSIAVVDEIGMPLEQNRKSEPVEKSSASVESAVAYCSVCGKPLTDPESIARGMGKICADNLEILGTAPTREHMESLKMQELPDDWISIYDWFAYGKSVGISAKRLMNAAGGDRALRKPVHPSFQIMYYKGKRYVHKSAIENIDAARLKLPD